jgi:Kinesin motor domain
MEEVCALLNHGERNRHFSSTILNHCSSRSHALFTVDLIQYDGDKVSRESRMTFIDLAGCERIDTSLTKSSGKEC